MAQYVLSPDHEYGRHKARVFMAALGIDRDSWEYLREQITTRVVDAEVSEVRAGRYGLRYSVPMLIEGLNGQTHEVTTGWIIEREGGGRAAAPHECVRQCPLSWPKSSMSSS